LVNWNTKRNKENINILLCTYKYATTGAKYYATDREHCAEALPKNMNTMYSGAELLKRHNKLICITL